jgi:hypothetical protein
MRAGWPTPQTEKFVTGWRAQSGAVGTVHRSLTIEDSARVLIRRFVDGSCQLVM